MIIAYDTTILSEDTHLTSYWENEIYKFAWKGFVFIPGIRAGRPSIEHVARCLSGNRTIAEATLPLKGDFYLIIRDKKKHINYALTDHNGMFQIYYTDRLISTSYLELLHYLRIKKSDLSKETIVEFLHLGNLYFKKTFTACIRKISSEEILTFASNGTVRKIKKSLCSIDQSPGCSFTDFFHNLSSSISNERISVDLTGGFDTRLIACMFTFFGLDFEVAVSGIENHEDIIIAKQVAVALKRKLYITYHQIDNLVDDIKLMFIYNDGLGDVLKFHRLAQFQGDRKQRGITLAINGVGGEFYCDYWWIQDFPFYNKSIANIPRLFDLRIEPIVFPHEYFTGELRELSETFRDRMIKCLNQYVLGSNTQTYDNIYYYVMIQELAARDTTNINNHFLSNYTPLCDLELVTLGFNLPRTRRFFNLFKRSYTYDLYPQIAKIRTADGFSASLDKLDIVKDAFNFIGNKGKRVMKKVGQRVLKKTYFQANPNHPDLLRLILDEQLMDEIITSLKDHHLLNHSLSKGDIRSQHIGRILTLGLLLNELY